MTNTAKTLKAIHFAAICNRYEIIESTSFIRAARRAELKLQRWSEYMCGEGARDYDYNERRFYSIIENTITSLAKYCGNPELFRAEIWVNRDPRGYALKLYAPEEAFVGRVSIDWGKNVILAPEF